MNKKTFIKGLFFAFSSVCLFLVACSNNNTSSNSASASTGGNGSSLESTKNSSSGSATSSVSSSSSVNEHVHNYEVVYDETKHWDECECGERKEAEEHNFTKSICENCEYTQVVFTLSSDNLYYTISGYNGTPENIEVPSTYKKLPVKEISENTFSNCDSLESIIIPTSVTKIGSNAFSNCINLESITLPFVGNSLNGTSNNHFGYIFGASSYLENSSVIPTSLKEVNIIGGETIKEYAFSNCENLKSINISNGIEKIERAAFLGCNNLESITLPFVGNSLNGTENTNFSYIFGSTNERYNDIFVPTSLKEVIITGGESIPDYAFYRCSSIESIIIPSSVTSIGRYAFAVCSSLTSITIPSSVSTIDRLAFHNCDSLMNVYYDGTIEDWCNIEFKMSYSNPMNYAPHFYISNDNEYEEVTEIVIPSTITEVGNYQFYGFDHVTTITIPSSVTSIGSSAFYDCDNLLEVYNLSSLKIESGSEDNGHVGYYAEYVHTSSSNKSQITKTKEGYVFLYDKSSNYYLIGYEGNETELVLPENINGKSYSIKKEAFVNNISITSITIPSTVTSVGEKAFYECTSLEKVYYKGDFEDWCKIVFADSTSNPMCYASYFYTLSNNEYKEVTEIVIPSTITEIGKYQFEGFRNVTSITIPSSVTSIGLSSFSGCSSLKTVIFEANSKLETISNSFSGCSALESITIPSKVTSIGYSAFSGCYRLFEIYNLSSLTIESGVPGNGYVSYYAKVIHSSSSNKSQIIRTNDGYIFGYDSSSNYYLIGYEGKDTELVLPESINGNSYSIKNFAFSYNTNITSVTIPSNITSIEMKAFDNCTSLKTVTFKENSKLKTIRSGAFSYCTSLISITIPSSVVSIGDEAFYACTSLEKVVVEANSKLDQVWTRAFYNCSSLTSFIIPKGTTILMYAEVFMGCYSLFEIYNLSTLRMECGSNDNGLISFYAKVIHKSLDEESHIIKTSDGYVFGYDNDNNYYLLGYEGDETKLVLPESINGNSYSIRNSAFYNNDNIVSITIPGKVTNIGDSAFAYCDSLKRVFFSEDSKLEAIGSQAFYNCTSLDTVIIPSFVTSIGNSAFSRCSALVDVYNNSDLVFVVGNTDYGEIGKEANNIYNEGEWKYLDGVPVPVTK